MTYTEIGDDTGFVYSTRKLFAYVKQVLGAVADLQRAKQEAKKQRAEPDRKARGVNIRPVPDDFIDDMQRLDASGSWERVYEPLPPAPETLETKIKATPFVWRDPSTIAPRQWADTTSGATSPPVAPGGLGKSNLALLEAVAMASGRNLLGSPVPCPLRVWYVNLEDPREELDRRIAAICLHYRIKVQDLVGRLFVDTERETRSS